LWDTFTNQLVAIEPPATYTQDLFVQRALDFIQRNATNRFFLYLPFTPPHANSTMKRIDVPEIEPEYVDAPWPDTEKRFASTITRLDRHVGLLMDKLRDLGLEQNTVVIVTSDNGAHAAGGHDYTFFNSTGSLRGRKFSVHEGVHRALAGTNSRRSHEQSSGRSLGFAADVVRIDRVASTARRGWNLDVADAAGAEFQTVEARLSLLGNAASCQRLENSGGTRGPMEGDSRRDELTGAL
jgi:hypothetical protein